MKRPTMADVAARVGVSRQLVSLVFRDAPGASADTRARVRKAAEELGYSPDIAARTLRRGTSKYLGVVFTPAYSSESDIVAGIYPAALNRGYNVVLSALTPTRDTRTAVEELLGYRSEALILIGSLMHADALEQLAVRVQIPIVSLGWGSANESYDVVRSAGDVGIEQAVLHLADLGHRQITYVHSETMPPASVRLEGYERAMTNLSLTPRVIVMSGDYTEESGSGAAARLLAEDALPTAVVTGNDQAALGLIHSLLRAGVAIPKDVSVTGFDDSRIAQLSFMDLTSPRQDPVEMGHAAVEAAIRRIGRSDVEPAEFVITPRLVVRGSTAVPRTNNLASVRTKRTAHR
jgi:DNA-binding LacI/PurR family transcriptional regulator